jgi:hypothetical protein
VSVEKVVDKRIAVKIPQTITIWGLFDCHVDSNLCDHDSLRDDIAEIAANPHARVVLGGDFNDMMFNRNDPRAYAPGVHRVITDAKAENRSVPKAIAEWNLELLRPIADKIDVVLTGNHEQAYYDRHDSNVARDTADAINEYLQSTGSEHRCEYAGYMCFLRYFLTYTEDGWDKPISRVINGFLHHGTGGGAPVTKGMIDIYRDLTKYNFHWAMRGHIHKLTASEGVKTEAHGTFGNGRVRNVPNAAIISPGYQRSYSNDATHYFSERKAHDPNPIGAGKIYMDIKGRGSDGLKVKVRWN